MTPRERRDNPRRVADRSVAMRRTGSGLGWLWMVLAIAGGLGGAAYYYSRRGFAPFAAAAAADSADAAAAAAAADSLRAADSRRTTDSLRAAVAAADSARSKSAGAATGGRGARGCAQTGAAFLARVPRAVPPRSVLRRQWRCPPGRTSARLHGPDRRAGRGRSDDPAFRRPACAGRLCPAVQFLHRHHRDPGGRYPGADPRAPASRGSRSCGARFPATAPGQQPTGPPAAHRARATTRTVPASTSGPSR